MSTYPSSSGASSESGGRGPLFVAGATGATGRTLVRLADRKHIALVPHVRPGREHGYGSRAAVLELADGEALSRAMSGCSAVLQLIGTMRKRFARGDTYETSDIATTQQLVDAARRAGVGHIVLLSSVGAGRPTGSYLQAKAKAEAIVRDSGLAYTILRPSSFVGEGHKPPPGLLAVTRLLGLDSVRPIAIEDLAAALLHVALTGQPKAAILEGKSLWAVVDAAQSLKSE